MKVETAVARCGVVCVCGGGLHECRRGSCCLLGDNVVLGRQLLLDHRRGALELGHVEGGDGGDVGPGVHDVCWVVCGEGGLGVGGVCWCWCGGGLLQACEAAAPTFSPVRRPGSTVYP